MSVKVKVKPKAGDKCTKAVERKAGRPKAVIDWVKVGEMLEAGSTAEGIAATIGISRDALYKRCQGDNNADFSTFSQQKRAKGDDMLRAKQFEVAMTGDKTMLIWLGKQRLGQAEKQEVDHTVTPPAIIAETIIEQFTKEGWTEKEVHTMLAKQLPEISNAVH
jgi:hypothetical protein